MSTNINLNDTDKVNIKISYLNILQNIINRMATFSLAMKTASVTTLTALLAYSASDTVSDNFKLWMFFIPWLFFAGYHAFFLRLEKIFRSLYNNSANQSDISFADFSIDKNKLRSISSPLHRTIFSLPFLLFHLILIAIVSISFLKIQGILCF